MIAGSQRRKDRREGVLSSLTRAEAFALIRNCSDVSELGRFSLDTRPRVRRAVFARGIVLLSAQPPHPKELSDFDALVERFRALGKPDPVASAKASLLARSRKRA